MAVTGGLMVLASLTSPAALYGWIGVLAVLRSDLARVGGRNPAEIFT